MEITKRDPKTYGKHLERRVKIIIGAIFAIVLAFLLWQYWLYDEPQPFWFISNPLSAYDENPEFVVFRCKPNSNDDPLSLCSIKTNGEGFQIYDVGFVNYSLMSTNVHGDVAFGCYDRSIDIERDERGIVLRQYFEICTINSDDSQLSQITNNRTLDLNPSINDSGQIAYNCTSPTQTETHSLCLYDPSNGVSELYSNEDLSVWEPQLSNDNLIFIRCGREQNWRDLCSIQTDGENFHTVFGSDVSIFSFERTRDSRIGLACARFYRYCSANIDGSDLKELYSIFDGSTYALSVNERGDFLFPCGDRTLNLCVVDIDGDQSDIVMINPDIDFEYRASGVAISSSGVIAYPCPARGSYHICIMKSDGSDAAVLTRHLSRAQYPVFKYQVNR